MGTTPGCDPTMTEAGEWIDAKVAMVGRVFSPSRALRVVSAQLGENTCYVAHSPMLSALSVFHAENITGRKAEGATCRCNAEQRAAMRSGVYEARRDHNVRGHCRLYSDLKVWNAGELHIHRNAWRHVVRHCTDRSP